MLAAAICSLADAIPDASFIEDPGGGHTVLRDDCMRQIRNAWLAGDPAQPPPKLACLASRALTFTNRP